ncbi:MAG TPA: hypothetical protein DCM28_20000 [Phycisphaerales bacterium]|nr:hypothetical protein [Phycisphaerales bacterium]HCD32967.1 hypothetical protein [Phycisphaerales bacterium]|tara:strand:+ start:23 stop:409 length:387 start_codon:yes stop_codon:yes gene_type:complete
MIHSPEAESATLYMLRESWEQAVMRKQANSLPNPLLDDLNDRIAHDMLPMLVHLLQERHDCDIQLLMHTVKSIVVEHMFYENAVSQVQWQQNIDAQVKLITAVVQGARERLIAEGEWCKDPVAPQMFG